MPVLEYDDVAQDLFEAWLYINHRDTPVEDYYDACDMAAQLTNDLLKPFRKEFIETVMTLAMDDSEAQQIQYLYSKYNNINNPDDIDALVIQLYLIMIEQYMVPFHTQISIVNNRGAILFNTKDIYND